MNIEAFYKVSYGLYIIGAAADGKMSAYVANTAFQVTAEPPRFAISCSKNNHTIDYIRKGRAFTVSVLSRDASPELIGTFGYQSTRDIDKFSKVNYKTGTTGAPIVTSECIAWFECNLEQEIVLDTHVIFIGSIKDNGLLKSDGIPLTYSYYREVKKGKAPKNAPTYISTDKEVIQIQDKTIPDGEGEFYSCDLCGYEYDPAEGDPDRGIPPGTPFADLPDDWECPVCGAGKEDFTKV